ncbi:FIG00774806: hypothetical protein [uncultured Candidatus Thioglobus sp.]|nr:FIG00774806: hypothetical protein [uncultured Candidatus Thioglobus sp.]
MAKEYELEIDVRILELLGPSLYTNIYYVLAELVANSYDAGAKNVYIISKDNEIIVEDDGSGMSYEDNDIKKYLGVAKETRTTEAESVIKVDNETRRKMGRKGVGKLAALSVSENVLIKTVKNNEKSGFILSRKVDESKKLKALNDDDISFEKISNNGTSIVMQNPQYNIHKTIGAIKNNLLKIFPIVSKTFKIHIITNKGSEVIDSFDKEMITGLGALITLGGEYKYLSKSFNFENFVEEKNKRSLLKNELHFSKTIELEDKYQQKKEPQDRIKKSYKLEIKGWIGAYKRTKGRKGDNKDFPDNFVSLLSNGKVGEFNILPAVGNNRLMESYVIGQLHIDLFEKTELPDIALSNRQGYKTDDLRYIEVIDHIKNELLPKIIKMRELYGDYKNKKTKLQKEQKKLEKEETLRKAARKYKEEASSKIIDKLPDLYGKNDKYVKKIIDEAINETIPLMGLKKEVDTGKKKILISHANIEHEDKLLSDLICQMLEFNGIPSEYIIYTSSDNSKHRPPALDGILDYLRSFFVDSVSSERMFTIYVTSEKMSKKWNPMLEVGAGWITQGGHMVFNSGMFTPQSPLNTVQDWGEVNLDDGTINMDSKSIDVFCEKIIAICKSVEIQPKDNSTNKIELERIGVNII